jgi:hypothetical protein
MQSLKKQRKERRMKAKYLALLIAVAGICGCAGVKFAPAPVNEPMPEAFTKRSVYPGGVAGYDFQDLVGNILFIEAENDPIRIDVIRPTGYKNEVIPVTDPNNFYRSRIQTGAEAQGSYLAFAAKFTADEMAELTLDDIARTGIVLSNEATWADIKNKIVAWVQAHPKKNPNAKRLWGKSVVLNRRVYNSHTKIDANTSGQVGDVTGVKTGVYRKAENAIKSVMLSFEAFDVDKLASEAARMRFFSLSADELLEKARYIGVIEGKIKIE